MILVFALLENCSPIWRRPYYRLRTANLDLCSALMAIEQLGIFSVPHLHVLLHRSTHTWCRGFISGPVWALGSVSTGDLTPFSHIRGKRSTSTPLRRRIVNVQCIQKEEAMNSTLDRQLSLLWFFQYVCRTYQLKYVVYRRMFATNK